MGMPILTPGPVWTQRMLAEMFRMWGMLSKDSRHRPPGCATAVAGAWCVDDTSRRAADSWPFGEPFLDLDEEPLGKLAFYLTISDVQRYPYVLHFASIAEL